MAERGILIVCTGNICRSPMAEGILRVRLAGQPGWTVASAGVGALNGLAASLEAREVCTEIGVDISAHRSRALTREMVDRADLVLVMTAQHRQEVLRRFPAAAGKVRLLTSFGPKAAEASDIFDPLGGDKAVYRVARDLIVSAVSDVVLYIVEQSKGGDARGNNG